MAGACVYSGNILQALDLKNNHTAWVVVGQTTPWANEENPPDVDLSTTDINEIQGAKRCNIVSLCVPDASGTIEFQGQKYRLVSDSEAYSQGARWVYFRADLKYDQFPVVTYRQTALYIDLVPASGYEGYDVLYPTQIESNGILYYYKNHPPRYRTVESVDIVEVIIEVQGQIS